MSKKYNDTLNLPKTNFQMKAHLVEREPEFLKFWNEIDVYNKVLNDSRKTKKYVLHDGPPYANGDIHLGHALNKILKDFIVKYKSMCGYLTPFRPGWDTHGLPTEMKTKKSVKDYDKLSVSDLRDACKNTALGYLNSQRESFKRLGIFADWDNPYVTLDKEYEAKQIEVFARLVREGAIYRGMKPVYWCTSCKTALAEAEIEYKQDPCRSIFVKFQVKEATSKISRFKSVNYSKLYFLIWTTTAWTLPGNVAICVNALFDYSIVKVGDEFFVMAFERVNECMKELGIEEYKVIGSPVKGKELEGTVVRHPFLSRDSVIITGDHVNLESGTGCVHTAPGHGVEDFECCTKYDLDVLVPVDEQGVMNCQAGEFSGLNLEDASNAIIDKLESSNLLFGYKDIVHKYPHCWRCKEPIILRVTRQWFCSVNKFKDKAVKASEGVKWIPSWGRERIKAMVSEREDWCISRQRKWGVPIPIFFCENCGKPFMEYETIVNISRMFKKYGAGVWYEKNADFFATGNEVCSCGCKNFIKEKDIMDVWFDSGVSYYAALENDQIPADLYLEGSDQYRGWFQSSLLTSVGAFEKAPFKSVLTHGWVVDEESRKQSKSLGNVISPNDIVNTNGADILRLWVASSDYTDNVKISGEIISQISESYRKIRNTARFILGNLYDFDPLKDCVAYNDLHEVDKYILIKTKRLFLDCLKSYDKFEFYSIFHDVQKFCVSQLSNFYLDVIKDRLYVSKFDERTRRACQTSIWVILTHISRILAPILSFTCEEIWKFIPKNQNFKSVFMNSMLWEFKVRDDTKLEEYWDRLIEVSDVVKKHLEDARQSKLIGSSLEACVHIEIGKNRVSYSENFDSDVKYICMVSDVSSSFGEGDGLDVEVSKSSNLKCQRCWIYDPSVGKGKEQEDLCERCIKVLYG